MIRKLILLFGVLVATVVLLNVWRSQCENRRVGLTDRTQTDERQTDSIATHDEFGLTKEQREDQAIFSYNAGIQLAKEGRYEDALKSYSIAIAMKPDLELAWVNRANLLMDLGDLENALKMINHAIELAPDDPLAYATRGNIFARQTKYPAAITEYNQALTLSADNNAGILRARGHAHAKNNDLEMAIKDTRQSLKLDSDNAQTYCNLAIFYARQGNDESIRVFDQALEKFPDESCVKDIKEAWDQQIRNSAREKGVEL